LLVLFFCYSGVLYIFFFQAEDGIRDFHVTGVQTCALPIFRPSHWTSCRCPASSACPSAKPTSSSPWNGRSAGRIYAPSWWITHRSEERRVGKECRYRWSQEQ